MQLEHELVLAEGGAMSSSANRLMAAEFLSA